MDKIEQLLNNEDSRSAEILHPDYETLIAGTHAKIKKRAIRRKALYSSPIVVLLLLVGLAFLPGNDGETNIPGGELLMAGWESTWTEIEPLESEDQSSDMLYEQSIDYLIDEQFYSYSDDSESFLDDEDLDAFIGYLTEA